MMSVKIANAGTAGYRQQFFDTVGDFPTNHTVAGLPISIAGLAGVRTMKGEQSVQDMYRDSIFCPCLNGDGPVQKRIFDAILSGCIPVVIAHDTSLEPGYPSHFSQKGWSTRLTYPFAKGVFHGMPQMGIDWDDLVVSINGTCGIPCLFPTLEDLLTNQRNLVREKQQTVMRYATLFSFGMEENKLQHADAIAATLVQARHFVNAEYNNQ